MFEIVNTPLNYSWGSLTAIAGLLGHTPSGLPEAELWFGDHPAHPARLASTGKTLLEWAAARPGGADAHELPFLVKILAAETPLSIQAHPDLESARRGFARENAAGIPLDSATRNYRDDNHKPEIIVALTEFSALCGLRPSEERDDILDALSDADVPGARELRERLVDGVAAALAWILGGDSVVGECARALPDVPVDGRSDRVRDAIEVARLLNRHFPSDPGIVVSLLLNHVILQPGEALFLPTGNIHAYLHGMGVEVMSRSDNVLRGGLTTKHIDVAELLGVADVAELRTPRLEPRIRGTVRTFDPGLSDFAVAAIAVTGDVAVDIEGPAIAVVVQGNLELNAGETIDLGPGRAAFIEAGETLRRASGRGQVIVAFRGE